MNEPTAVVSLVKVSINSMQRSSRVLSTEADQLSKSLFLNNLHVDSEYWGIKTHTRPSHKDGTCPEARAEEVSRLACVGLIMCGCGNMWKPQTPADKLLG